MRRRPERREWFRLALALGMSVAEAQSRISSAEFAEWIAFSRLEPYGPERADLRAGIVAATVANVHRDPKSKPFAPSAFMPEFDRQVRRQSIEEMKAALGMTGAGSNARR